MFASERSERATRTERAGEAARERACRGVEGRSPSENKADVAQLAERVLGKDEVTSSILVIGSRLRQPFGLAWSRQAGKLSADQAPETPGAVRQALASTKLFFER